MMDRVTISAWVLALGMCAALIHGQVINTVAGTTWLFPTSSLQALSAPLGNLTALTIDSSGNLYATDSSNKIVVRISQDGILTTIAGNGMSGFSGDGGRATGASGYFYGGLAVSPDGALYIADVTNHRIRKVGSNGIINTVAGSGPTSSAAGITFGGFSGDGGPATSALLSGPRGVVADSAGSLYIADLGNNRIRKISPDGSITTVAGNGVAAFSGDDGPAISASLISPNGIALDADNNLYIADVGNNRIRKVTSSGLITTVAGDGTAGFSGDGGPATSASLKFPRGVALDVSGSLYIADEGNSRVRKVDPSGIISTIAGNGTFGLSGDGGSATQAALSAPAGVTVDLAGNLYIADNSNKRIRKVSPDGIIITVAGNGLYKFAGDGEPAISASLALPEGVAVDALGNIYTSDSANNRIRRIDAAGAISTVAGNGTFGFSGDGGPATDATLNSPLSVAVDSIGDLYISDAPNGRIRKVSPNGVITTFAGNGSFGFSGDGGPAISASLSAPNGIALDADNNLYIADIDNNRIRKVTLSGLITTVAGDGTAGFSGDGGLATSASLNFPRAVALDVSGSLYIADEGNSRVRKVGPSGIISTIAGNGTFGFSGDGGLATNASLSSPNAVAVDAAGNVYISDVFNSRIRKVNSAGIISTAIGSGTPGYSGDGGTATTASLNLPAGLALDSVGNLYIADTNNDRIREVFAGAVSYRSTPASLSFSAIAGGSVPGTQTINLSSSIAGLGFTISTDVPWLSVSPSSGSMPVGLQVRVDPSGLQPGTYKGTVGVKSSLADPAIQPVAVMLTLSAANPPKVGVQPSVLSLSAYEGSPPAQQTVFVSNTGSGSLTFNATASSDRGWLSLMIVKSTVLPAAPGSLTITADPAGLSASGGPYTSSVEITSPTTGEKITVPVTLAITPPNKPKLLLSQTGLSFRTIMGGGDSPQCFAVINTGQGTLNFSVSSDAAWLTATQQTCPVRAVSSQAAIPEVVVGIAADGLKPGDYKGNIQVTAPDAGNSPQSIGVTLTVLSSSTQVGPIVRPSGLVFMGTAGGGQPPGSLDVTIYSPTINNAYHYTSNSQTLDGDAWFSHLPTSGNVPVFPAAPPSFRVFPDLSRLTASTYHGTITLLTEYGGRLIDVLAVVAPGASSKANFAQAAAAVCRPTALNAIFTQVDLDFTARVGKAFPIELYLADDCGDPMATGSVVAGFSNGDTALSLVPLGDGRWAGTWVPTNVGDSRVQITVQGRVPATGVSGTAQRSGGLQ